MGMQLSGFVVVNMVLAGILFWFSWIIGKRHKSVIEDNFGNVPPQLALPLPDMDILAGEISQFVMDADTFVDPDEGDVLEFTACLDNHHALPQWLHFNQETLGFQGQAPCAAGDVIHVILRATDYDGAWAEGKMQIRVE